MAEPTRLVGIAAENLELGTGPDGTIVVKLRGVEKEFGMAPGIGVMLLLSPQEARLFGQALLRIAAEDK